MPLEQNPVTISDLDRTSPAGGEFLNEGDDHIRNVKSVLTTQFPGELGAGLTAPVTANANELNATVGATGNFQAQIDAINQALGGVLAAAFPIGFIYTTIDPTNPATVLGFGTWEAFGQGRTLVGLDPSDSDFNPVLKTAGTKDAVVVQHTHTGTASTAGQHLHRIAGNEEVGGAGIGPDDVVARSREAGDGDDYNLAPSVLQPTVGKVSTEGAHTHNLSINTTGVSPTDANLQPYVVVYFWRRIT